MGQGGFGRTYLCEDGNRFKELCILKEFAPQVRGTDLLTKAQELFEREAGVMYRLQHPQIPQFREMFRANNSSGQGQLFLVQDYVEGSTYQQLLREKLFTEAQVRELLIQTLPVLDYLHSLGVIHRDISPDNLIRRQRDGVPVLIDFGGVKQVAAHAAHPQALIGQPRTISGTRLGKVGYAPMEQMHQGKVYPHSDIYALAATAIVLMTGLEPVDLIDGQNFTWNWRSHLHLTPEFGRIIDQMLAPRPHDRYPTAKDALAALEAAGITPSAPITPDSTVGHPTVAATPTPAAGKSTHLSQLLTQGLLWMIAVAGATLLGWLAAKYIVQPRSQRSEIPASVKPDATIAPSVPAMPTIALDRQLQSKVNTYLHPASRSKIGSYSQQDLKSWESRVNKLYLSGRTLNDLTNAKYRVIANANNLQKGFNSSGLFTTNTGQVYLATIDDRVRAIETKQAWGEIIFKPGEISGTVGGTLGPGEGKAWIASLNKNQEIAVEIQSDEPDLLLSVYPPSSKMSPIYQGTAEQVVTARTKRSGYHEFTIVSHSNKPISYRLTLFASEL
jgi:serine/threonine protein kinase, bacterial